ncbi:MAG TPA: helix-turn-helix domain-containing protein [Pyrinomonadaceae bacterium]
MPAEAVEHQQEPSAVGVKIQALKELVCTLLNEMQALEREALMSELATPRKLHAPNIENGIKLDEVVRQFETGIIEQALSITGGNQARAAQLLGIKANTLNYKVKLYKL